MNDLTQSIQYTWITSMPDRQTLQGVFNLHARIFGDANELKVKMENKPELLIHLACHEAKVIGYKMGYELEEGIFYSWLGGVDPAYRNCGIASKLMENQHEYIKEKGYKVVRTKTMNKWRSMLILNIKNGFNIIGTVADGNGETKIVLEKSLSDGRIIS